MTDFYQVKDRAYTTLASGLTDVALVAVYTSGGVFGSGNCIITCEDEKINQTVRSGNWATISRGFGGTTAAAHVIGTPVSLNVTAGVIGQMQSGVYALESVSGAVNVGSLSGDVYALKGVSGTVYAHATTHLSGGADLLSGIALSSLGEAVAPAGCLSIFVASSTASAAEKALATSTYTMDQTDDHVQLNAAILAV